MYNKNQGNGKFKGIYTPKKCAYKNKIHVQSYMITKGK